jgi:hypothetical protein
VITLIACSTNRNSTTSIKSVIILYSCLDIKVQGNEKKCTLYVNRTLQVAAFLLYTARLIVPMKKIGEATN